MSLRVRVFPDYDAVSRAAADELEALLKEKPAGVIGLATGETPRGLYRELIRRQPDCSEVRAFHLDEYRGLVASDPRSYAYYMNNELFSHLNFQSEHLHLINGNASDPVAECARYEQAIAAAGGIDLQLLGIGRNGHIGFNEPGPAWTEGAHVVTLAESTKQANAPGFDNDPAQVPDEALTLGIGNIMQAKRILLLATGASKAAILAEALTGAVTPEVPASILQQHPDVLVLADEAAAAELPGDLRQ